MSQDPEDVTIRPAVFEDAQPIALVHIDSSQEAYAGIAPDEYVADGDVAARTDHWREQLGPDRDPDVGVWIAEVDGKVRGFASIGPSRDEDAERRQLEIYTTYLDPRYWGRGLARELMRTLLAEVPVDVPISLWVPAESSRARHFYRRHGFNPDGTERMRQLGGTTLLETRYRR